MSILTRWKCHVTTALNGLSGFEERISHRGKKAFDLCLMDLHMVRFSIYVYFLFVISKDSRESRFFVLVVCGHRQTNYLSPFSLLILFLSRFAFTHCSHSVMDFNVSV